MTRQISNLISEEEELLPDTDRWADWEAAIEDIFDINRHDLRYDGGVAALYADLLHVRHPEISLFDLEKAARKFVGETFAWHETRRFAFQPYPDFDVRILEIVRENKDELRDSP